MAVVICAAVSLALTMYSLQTKWGFTLWGGVVFLAVVVVPASTILATCIPYHFLPVMFGSLGALLFGCYLVFDIQWVLGDQHNYSISPEEYIFAALNVSLDIVHIFIYVLALAGGRNQLLKFTP